MVHRPSMSIGLGLVGSILLGIVISMSKNPSKRVKNENFGEKSEFLVNFGRLRPGMYPRR